LSTVDGGASADCAEAEAIAFEASAASAASAEIVPEVKLIEAPGSTIQLLAVALPAEAEANAFDALASAASAAATTALVIGWPATFVEVRK
jgi:hypothetical protein